MKRMLKLYFSHWPNLFYWAIFLAMAAVNIANGESFFNRPLTLIIPLAITPFYEWLAHKYFLHMQLKNQNSWLYRYMERSHYGHHKSPTDPVLVFAQPSLSLFMILKFYLLTWLVIGNLQESLLVFNVVLGIYLYYEWTHLGHHLEGYNHLTPYGRYMKKCHQWHHFKNENYWWGITTNLGDLVFRTNKDPKDVPKSQTVKDINPKRNYSAAA